MTRPALPSTTDLIGVLLVAVALVSAGGLFYISTEYTKISDTLVSVDVDISAMTLVRSNSTGDVTLSILITLDNPSDLDIEIYRIEYMTFVDRTTASLANFDRYVGAGSSNEANGTVLANSVKDTPLSHTIPTASLYMNRLNYALDGDDNLFAYAEGFIWFKLVDYPDVSKRLPISYLGREVVQFV